MKFNLIIFFLLFSVVLLGNKISKYDYIYKDNTLIISFNLEESNKPQVYSLNNPFRIMLDFKDMKLDESLVDNKQISDDFIKNIFFVEFKRNNLPYVKTIMHFKSKKEYKIEEFGNKLLITIKGVKAPEDDEIEKEIEKIEAKSKEVKPTNKLNSYDLSYGEEDLILSFKLDKEEKPKIITLDNPFRIMLDFKNISVAKEVIKTNILNNQIINQILTIPFTKNGVKYVRIMINLKSKKNFKIENFNKNVLLTINDYKKKVKKAVVAKKQIGDYLESYKNSYQNNDLIIAFKLTKEVTPKIIALENPSRIMLDFEGLSIGKDIVKTNNLNDEIIEKILTIPFTKNGSKYVRVMIQLKKNKKVNSEKFGKNFLLTILDAKTNKKVKKTEKIVLDNVVEKDYTNKLNNYDISYGEDDVIMSFQLDKESKPRVVTLNNPFRIMLDFKNISMGKDIIKTNNLDNAIIKKVLTIPFTKNGVKYLRVMIHLKKKKNFKIENFAKVLILTVKDYKKVAKKVVKKQEGDYLESYNYSYQNDDLIISFKSTKEVTPKVVTLTNPTRIMLDFKGLGVSRDIVKTNNINNKIIEKILTIPFEKNGTKYLRVMVQLKKDKKIDIEKFGKNFLLTIINAKKDKKKVFVKKVDNSVGNRLNSYQVNYENNNLILSFNLQKEMLPKIISLDNPFRIMLDFKGVTIGDEVVKTNNINDKVIDKILTIPFEKNGTKYLRVMIQLKKSGKFNVDQFGKTFLLTILNIQNSIPDSIDKTKIKTNSVQKGDYLESYNHSYQNDNLIIAFKLTKEITPKVVSLENPFRIMLDFKNLDIGKNILKTNNINDGVIDKILAIPFEKNRTKYLRIMIQLKEKKQFEAERFNKNFLLTIKNTKKGKIKNIEKNSYKLIKTVDDKTIKNEKIKLKISKDYKHQLEKKAPNVKNKEVNKENKNSSKKTKLMKLGFKKYKDVTRVTINTDSPALYEIDNEANKLTIVLKDCKLGQHAAKLTLDTSYFNSIVQKIKPIINSDNEIEVEIYLKKPITPIFTKNRNNIFIDFKEE